MRSFDDLFGDPEEARIHEEYVAQRLRLLADQMADVAGLLEYIHEARAAELLGASRLAASWADAIEALDDDEA